MRSNYLSYRWRSLIDCNALSHASRALVQHAACSCSLTPWWWLLKGLRLAEGGGRGHLRLGTRLNNTKTTVQPVPPPFPLRLHGYGGVNSRSARPPPPSNLVLFFPCWGNSIGGGGGTLVSRSKMILDVDRSSLDDDVFVPRICTDLSICTRVLKII